MTLKSGTGQACAACKYQRRRCTPECLLAPFFPADQPKMFQNVHRLFGVKNIQNLLKDLSHDHKAMAMAMKSIKFHATMRAKYPVYGCLVEIQHLTYQIQMAEEELQVVLQQLTYYRQQQLQQELSPTDDYMSELQLGMAPPGNTPMSILQDENNVSNPQQYNGVSVLPVVPSQQQQQTSYSNSGNGDYSMSYLDFKDNNVVSSLSQQTYSNNNENNTNSAAMHPQPLIIPIQQETVQEYNEMHPFFDNNDDTQSYISSKEAYESSLESSLKDTRHLIEHMDDNELKNAAAYFSLTSVN